MAKIGKHTSTWLAALLPKGSMGQKLAATHASLQRRREDKAILQTIADKGGVPTDEGWFRDSNNNVV